MEVQDEVAICVLHLISAGDINLLIPADLPGNRPGFKKIAALRKELKLSQTALAKQLNTSVSVISRYERDEMTPSIDVAKKLAGILNTTVGYLLDETDQENLKIRICSKD